MSDQQPNSKLESSTATITATTVPGSLSRAGKVVVPSHPRPERSRSLELETEN